MANHDYAIRYKLAEAIKSTYAIQEICGKHALLKRAEDGLYDMVQFHPSKRKAEASLVGIVTAG